MKKLLLLITLLMAMFAPLAMMGQTTNQLLSENFDSMSSISTSYSSTSWFAYNAGSGNNWTLNTSSTYANSGSKSAQVQYHSNNAANCYLISKPFTVSSNMDQLSVSLYERVRSGSYAETFDVFFVKASDFTTAAGVASATKYTAVASASYTNTTYAQKTGSVSNSALAGQSVRVVVHCTSAADKYYLYIDDITVTETLALPCPTPTITGVTPTAHEATIAVSGTSASNFNVRYRVAGNSTTYGFEDGIGDWTTIDADGDGFNWVLGSATDGVYTYNGALSSGYGNNSTDGLIVSGSYRNTGSNSGVALTPDNYLVSKQISLGGAITFYAHGSNSSYVAEHFGVFVSTNSNNNPSDFIKVSEWTATTTTYTSYFADLSAYSGQGYVAIRHFDCTDMFLLSVDDITIVETNPWQNANDLTLTGLDPDTDYEVQVQAVCGGSDGESNWSSTYTFTTLESVCDVPSNLSANNITNTGATLSWTKGGTESAWVLEYGTASDFTGATPVTSGFSTNGTTVSKSLSLTAGTTYYARVKANCGQGDVSEWSDTYTFTTHSVPSVTTGSATSVIQTSFTMGGTLDNAGGVAATRGIWYSTNNPNNNPNSGNGTMVAAGAASTETGAYTVDLTNLSAGTTYYCCAYATNTYGTVFGNVVTVTTPNIGAPVVTTNSTCTADDTSITCGGNVTSDGGNTITERGICYMQGTSGDPTTSNTCVTASGTTGAFTVTLDNLTPGTSYLCRAYATNSNGTSYGDTYTFSTGSMPTVVTSQATSVSSINITIGGILTSTGGASTTYGICYSHTVATPTISDSKVEAGTTNEDDTYFDVTLLSLTPGYIYYCRAFATNAFGTTYGDVVVVVTNATAGTPVTETATVYVETNTFEEGKYLILHGNSVGSQYAMNNNNGSSINRTSVTVQNGTITPVGGTPTIANYVETLTTTCVWGVGETSSGTLVIYNDYNGNDYYLAFTNSNTTYGYPLSLSTSGGLTWTYSNNVLGYSGGGFNVYYTNNNYYINSSNSTSLYLFKGMDVITDSYYNIEVSATTGGTVSQTNSNGHYSLGDVCSVTATPNSGYTFAYWSENGREISYKPTYTFQVDDNRNLVAHFNEITLCPKPTHFDVDNIGGHDAELSWKNTGAETYEVRYGEYTIEPLWLQYDNNDFESGYGGSSEAEKTWGVLYTSDMLNGNNTITKFAMQEYPTWQTASTYTVKFYSGGTTSPETLIGTETVTMTGSTGMHEVTLSSPIAFDPTQNLWITVTTTGTYVMCCCTNNNNPNNTWYLNSSSGSWEQMEITDGWMIRGYVEYDSSVAPNTIVPPYSVSIDPSSITWTTKEPTTDNPYELAGLASGTRYVTQVRGNCGGGDGDSPWSDMIVFTTLPTYNVTLNTNGGTINSGNINEYTYTVGATLPTDITKTGFVFAGWYDNSSLTGTAVTTISTTDTGDKEFWAAYEIGCDITLTANPTEGGTLAGAGTHAVGTEVTVSATANSPYQFINWTENGTVVSTDASYTFTVTADRALVANFGFKKEIQAWDNVSYYLIASPLASNVYPTDVTNMIAETAANYDLYRFNQSNSATEWENYKQNHFTTLENGKGYLYANKSDVTLVFMGTAYSGNGVINLTQDASNTTRGNWNLVGNPYPETANIGSTPYYKMKADGSDIVSTSGGTIAPMEAVFVLYDSENSVTSVTFAKGAPAKASEQLTLNVSQGRSSIDRAIIRFDEGSQLDKFQLFGNSTKIYIPQNTKEYAVVSAEAQGEMPVNFKAESNGTYTIGFSTENVEFNYLHLIDNMTGADVDLLVNPSYSFNATTSDYESRFKLVFAAGNTSNDSNFAFFSDGNIIVNGEGTLEVIDMMGRIVSTSQVNGMSSVNLNAAAGVYVLQLTNGNESKTQKIVVK